MRLSYDPATDVLRIRLRAGRRSFSEEVEPGVFLEFDGERNVIGFELAGARRRLSPEELTSVSYENVASQRRASLTLP